MNSRYNNIKFTTETEKDNQLAFININKMNHGELEYKENQHLVVFLPIIIVSVIIVNSLNYNSEYKMV